MTVMAPKDENELKDMLHTAFNLGTPVSIRYPRGKGIGVEISDDFSDIPIGKAQIVFKKGKKSHVLIIAVGSTVYPAMKAAKSLFEGGISATVINARFVKPLDEKLIREEAAKAKAVITIEENALCGGFGSAVLEVISDTIKDHPFLRIGIPDEFIEHGSQKILREKLSLDAQGILEKTLEFLSKLNPSKNAKSTFWQSMKD